MFVDFLKGMKMTALNGYCIVGFDNFENFAVAMMYVYVCQKIWRRWGGSAECQTAPCAESVSRWGDCGERGVK